MVMSLFGLQSVNKIFFFTSRYNEIPLYYSYFSLSLLRILSLFSPPLSALPTPFGLSPVPFAISRVRQMRTESSSIDSVIILTLLTLKEEKPDTQFNVLIAS